jgi:hypothetical protein
MTTVKFKVAVTLANRGRKKIKRTAEPAKPRPRGKIPRVARLMALALQFEEMLQKGEVSDGYELASLYKVSQPRMSQILALALLAPDIQEAILNLPVQTTGRCQVHEKRLRAVCAEVDFDRQREMWRAILLAGSERA